MTTEIATREVMPLDVQSLIAQAIEHDSGIDTMERLVALAKEVRAEQAREAYYRSIAEFQRRCPAIKKTGHAKIQTRVGPGYAYRYAPLDEITSTIQPVMGELGLSISWRTRVEPDRVIASCRVSHTLGHHEESGEIAMPIVAGDSAGANPMQRVGIALTYSKRYSLLGIIGMAPEDDDDAEGAGEAPGIEPSRSDPEAERGPIFSERTVISENQVRRFSAIAHGAKWTDDQVHTLLSGYQIDHRKDIPVRQYEEIVEALKRGPGKSS